MDESPPGSPLSILSSDAFEGEEDHDQLATMHPAKRIKMGDSSHATPVPHLEDDNLSTISSDTEGDIPIHFPPQHMRPDEDEMLPQVTVCVWEDCTAGDLGNMDRLVEHIHAEHIESRQKKYTCEWMDCTRKSRPHASGYALKSHMRSHTREKPFYCVLPECDKAFTRSDALAKHMRTVHETEALRPSDPIPKTDPAKASRLKFIIKKSQEEKGIVGSSETQANGNPPPTETPEPSTWTSMYPTELGFTEEEESMSPKELYRLLRRKVHWAEEEAESLKKQCEFMEEQRRKEWADKEVLLQQTIDSEKEWHAGRKLVLAGRAESILAAQMQAAAEGSGSGDSNPFQAQQLIPTPLVPAVTPVQLQAPVPAPAPAPPVVDNRMSIDALAS